MANYQFLDAYSSVQTAASSVISGSAQAPFVIVSGSVITVTPAGGNQSVSGTVGSSLVGMLPAGSQVIGSVAVLQGTSPWNISSVYGNVSGSVLTFQAGGWNPSAIGYALRNDTLASTLGADQTYGPSSRDSAGRVLTRPYAAEEARVEGFSSVTSGSVTTILAAAGTGLRNYVTDVFVANSGSVTTLVTFKSNGGASTIGFTIAPNGGGSNLPGLVTPLRSGPNQTFDFQATSLSSILYITVLGYKAP